MEDTMICPECKKEQPARDGGSCSCGYHFGLYPQPSVKIVRSTMPDKSLTEQIDEVIAEVQRDKSGVEAQRYYTDKILSLLRSLADKELEMKEEEIAECIRKSLSEEEASFGDYVWAVTDTERSIAQAATAKASPKIKAQEEENKTIREKTLKEVGEWLDKADWSEELEEKIQALKSGKLE